jgi:hypothetical protein
LSAALSKDDKRLQTSVLFAVVAGSLFIVFLTVFLFNHADPKGDGMEMVEVGAAFMLIFLPLSLPAYLLAKEGHFLILAAFLAGLAAILYFLFWLEILDELGIQAAPWAGLAGECVRNRSSFSLEMSSQTGNRNNLRRHGRAGILAWPDAFDPSRCSRP